MVEHSYQPGGCCGASGLLVGVLASLDIHALQSEAIVRRHLAKTHSEMEALRAEVSGAMHRLGYNAIILPREQSLSDWYADDYASKMMPESHLAAGEDRYQGSGGPLPATIAPEDQVAGKELDGDRGGCG